NPPTFACSRTASGRRAVPGTPTTRSPAPTRCAISAVSDVRQTTLRGNSMGLLPYINSEGGFAPLPTVVARLAPCSSLPPPRIAPAKPALGANDFDQPALGDREFHPPMLAAALDHPVLDSVTNTTRSSRRMFLASPPSAGTTDIARASSAASRARG